MGTITLYGGATFVVMLISVATWVFLTSERMASASLFNRLFIVVAVTSALFSAVSSAIGFGLITSQETVDFFRNSVLPPAFGLFVFFVAVAIWVGGAELVRNRDWFRAMEHYRGPMRLVGDLFFFIERAVKLFILIPILAVILFLVSTWTSVVGIAGVDAVRYTYGDELNRLQTDCSGIIAYRRNDLLFLDDLTLSITDAKRAARREQEFGGQTGIRGRGAATDYIDGVAEWLSELEQSVRNIIITENSASDYNPYSTAICPFRIEELKQKLSRNAFVNYDLWAREFETDFEEFRQTLNNWRQDRRLVVLMEQQLSNFDRANPKPLLGAGAQGNIQQTVIDRYAEDVTDALASLVRSMKLRKPPIPLLSAAERSPERGLAIFMSLLPDKSEKIDEHPKRKPRTQAVVEAEFIAGLSVMTPRDAVLKNFQIFSDVWALALAWDYASYILLLAFLFFPSAERSARYKD